MKLFRNFILLGGLFFSHLVSADVAADDRARDSLLNVLESKTLSDSSRIKTQLHLVDLYSSYNETIDSAKMLSEKTLLLSRNAGYKKGEAWSLLNIGKALNHNPHIASSYFKKARIVFISIHDKDGLANTYLQDGVLMYVQKNYREAIRYFNQASILYEELKDTVHLARMQYLTGLAQTETGDFKNALPNLQSALNTYIGLQYESDAIQCRNGLADAYYHAGKLDDAMIYYRSIYEYAKKNNTSLITNSCIGLGNILLKQNKFKEAESKYLEAYEFIRNKNELWRKLKVANALFEFYEKSGNSQKAFDYLKIAKQCQDSIYNEKNMEAMANSKSEYDIGEAEKAVLKSTLQNESDKKIKISLLAILLLFAAIIYGISRRYYFKKKIAASLEEKNSALNKALIQLKSAEDQLIKSEKMAVFGKLSAGIAHEIRNPLNFITNFSELSEQIADDFLHAENESERLEMAQQLKKLVDKIGYHGRRADSIVTRMLQHSRTGHNEMEPTDVNRICEEFSDLAYQSMRNLVTHFECTLEKKLDPALPKIWLVPQDLSRVIINLLNNSFYAVRDKQHLLLNGYTPSVTISTEKNENQVIIKVIDNGNGIPADVKEKIFDPFFTTKPMGEGTGLGLSICADIIKAAHGEIKVESKAGEGTVFEVRFPITEI